ncbi:aldose epimerase family protein [Cellulosilyticum sp. I15G10I2]|uniref:aldose epimerase family protein n=1 Tax=Cellulosilyticum sp. I15G10I2 TaxID=1892843 RepID=UPI00085CD207|nr:aldose epimerase family protein [Cellulosilyticum sp. I15G10I2]
MIFKSEVIYEYDNKKVREYVMSNDRIEVRVINIGASLRGIYVPDKNGKMENVVLAHQNVAEYLKGSPYFGSIVGRSAGRIAFGQCELGDQPVQLTINSDVNHIHGGFQNLGVSYWDIEMFEDENEAVISCTCSQEDGHEGYPGNADFKVFYRLKDNSLTLEYEGVCDKQTIMNLTNHAAFNLSGDCKATIEDHDLKIASEYVMEVDAKKNVTGNQLAVEHTAFDFRSLAKIDSRLKKGHPQFEITGGIDHAFVLQDPKEIELIDEVSGRKINLTTDQACVVCYTTNWLGQQVTLQSGQPACKHMGICLETQDFPNGVNLKDYKVNQVFNAGEKYYSKTQLDFSVVNHK